MKCEADSVLGEVRQKQSEAGRMLEVLAAVGSLRQARLKKKVAQGHASSPSAGQQFTDALSELNIAEECLIMYFTIRKLTIFNVFNPMPLQER